MTIFFRNSNGRAANIIFGLTLICVSNALGDFQHILFIRTKGVMRLPISCALGAFSMDILAVEYDAAQRCQNLGWEWGHVYDDVSTYYEKQRVVEEYSDPKVLERTIWLPIIFDDGAYINMYMEFTTIDFSYGAIRLLNTLDQTFSIYDSSPEAIMISMEMRSGNNYQFKSWNEGWKTYLFTSNFPFATGIVYKITFKALGNAFQVLVNDEEQVQYPFDLHTSEARQLFFEDPDMTLHKIEYVT